MSVEAMIRAGLAESDDGRGIVVELASGGNVMAVDLTVRQALELADDLRRFAAMAAPH